MNRPSAGTETFFPFELNFSTTDKLDGYEELLLIINEQQNGRN